MSQQISNALFQKKAVKNALSNFQFPPDLEERHQIIIKWVAALNSSTLDISENYLTFTMTAFEEMKVKCKDTQIIR
jgi:hypothetical protein